MIAKEPKPHRQSFSTNNINKLIGMDNINAVKKESWRGEIFLGESMEAKLCAISHEL